jgi:hypothetical protein
MPLASYQGFTGLVLEHGHTLVAVAVGKPMVTGAEAATTLRARDHRETRNLHRVSLASTQRLVRWDSCNRLGANQDLAAAIKQPMTSIRNES